MAKTDAAKPDAAPPVPRASGRSGGRRHGVLLWVCLGWLALVIGLALGAHYLPLDSPDRISLLARRLPPSARHWLGTDSLGRDMLSRVIFGARASLTVGLGASCIGLVLGAGLGIAAGYFRGWMEVLTVGAMDTLLSFPPLVLALAVSAYLGKSVTHLTLVLALLLVAPAARVARSATLSVAQREFVMAAHALGAGHARIMLRQLLPNVAGPLLVFFLVAVALIIVAEGALSFIGLGVPAPQASWGSMIADGSQALDLAPHIAFVPSAAMFLTVLAFNLASDRLRAIAGGRESA